MRSLLLLFVVVAYIATGEALKCYECSDPPNSGCGNPFDSKAAGISQVTCTGTARCVKSVVTVDSVVHTARSCVTVPGSDGQPDQRTMNGVSANVWMCETDLCNGASSLTATTGVLFASALIVGFSIFRS